jgi:hypothetical protein
MMDETCGSRKDNMDIWGTITRLQIEARALWIFSSSLQTKNTY